MNVRSEGCWGAAGSGRGTVILGEGPASERQALGRAGEALASAALRRAGLRILERRYRRRPGEIDVIAECGELLVFVEVKTRRGTDHGEPAEAVTPVKRQRMARVALEYMARNGYLERPSRFDVVEVRVSESSPPAVRHIEDAFRLWRTG